MGSGPVPFAGAGGRRGGARAWPAGRRPGLGPPAVADLLPHAHGTGSYVNFITDYEADRVRASYGPAKYQRLTKVKAAYDPGNVVHRNANINPPG
jgi:Berberine and berberine like